MRTPVEGVLRRCCFSLELNRRWGTAGRIPEPVQGVNQVSPKLLVDVHMTSPYFIGAVQRDLPNAVGQSIRYEYGSQRESA
jgi:hypothetical protein